MKYLVTALELDNIKYKDEIVGEEVVEANGIKDAINKSYFKRGHMKYNYRVKQVDDNMPLGWVDNKEQEVEI